jgi:hypothetical protein
VASESFEIVGQIRRIETIASGRGIRDLAHLEEHFGAGNWRKLKGFATVRLEDGTIADAEIHWYEAHGNRQTLDKDQTLSRLAHE